MKINRLEQTFRRIIKDAGGEPDGNEEFFFHTLPSEGLPDDQLTERSICGIKRTSPALRGSMMIVSKRIILSRMFKGLPEPTITYITRYHPTRLSRDSSPNTVLG